MWRCRRCGHLHPPENTGCGCEPDENYYLDLYGECVRDYCGGHGRKDDGHRCLRDGWLGRACPWWKSYGARNLEELRGKQ